MSIITDGERVGRLTHIIREERFDGLTFKIDEERADGWSAKTGEERADGWTYRKEVIRCSWTVTAPKVVDAILLKSLPPLNYKSVQFENGGN